MDTIKTILIAAIAGVAVSAVFIFATGGKVEDGKVSLGAISSPDIPSLYLKWGAGNGVRRWPTAIAPTAATTTVCAIQAPAATSTLSSGGIILTVSSTTASTVTIAKSATAFATTTLIREASVSANAQATILAASTTESAIAQTNRIFAPNEWLVFSMAGGIGHFSPSGTCQATFEEFVVY